MAENEHRELEALISLLEDPDKLQADHMALAGSLTDPAVPIIIGGSQAGRIRLPDSALCHVGTSMGELEAMVKGLQVGAEVKRAS